MTRRTNKPRTDGDQRAPGGRGGRPVPPTHTPNDKCRAKAGQTPRPNKAGREAGRAGALSASCDPACSIPSRAPPSAEQPPRPLALLSTEASQLFFLAVQGGDACRLRNGAGHLTVQAAGLAAAVVAGGGARLPAQASSCAREAAAASRVRATARWSTGTDGMDVWLPCLPACALFICLLTSRTPSAPASPESKCCVPCRVTFVVSTP
jgi:hypothetical protein